MWRKKQKNRKITHLKIYTYTSPKIYLKNDLQCNNALDGTSQYRILHHQNFCSGDMGILGDC